MPARWRGVSVIRHGARRRRETGREAAHTDRPPRGYAQTTRGRRDDRQAGGERDPRARRVVPVTHVRRHGFTGELVPQCRLRPGRPPTARGGVEPTRPRCMRPYPTGTQATGSRWGEARPSASSKSGVEVIRTTNPCWWSSPGRRSSHSRFEQGTVTGARRVAAARRAHFYAHPHGRTFEGGIGLSRGAGPHFAATGTRPLYSL